MEIKLRPYQIEAIQEIEDCWKGGDQSVLMVMATGLGKTAVFLGLLNRVLTDGKRAMILAHRKELIDQPKDKLAHYYPGMADKVGIVMADQNEPDKQIIVATVQTLNTSKRRLDNILSSGKIDYLITDEAHHAVAASYIKLYDRLMEANPEMLHLGVTATPLRGDGAGLAEVYSKVSGKYGIVEGIQSGYLCPVRWLAIETGVSLSGVQISQGDFAQGQLSEVFSTDDNFDLVVRSHLDYAKERQGIAFTVLVTDAYRLAEKFNSAGIKAVAADGTTPKDQRQKVLDDFRSGAVQILCNVGLYTEGLDVPEASVIHQVRPTRSDGLYTQMVGRALRTFPGKEDALILDYVPEDDRNITMLGDVLGKPLRRDAVMVKDKPVGEVIGGLTFDGQFHWMAGSPVEIISRQLDYLDTTLWSWHRDVDQWMSLGLGAGSDEVERTLIISSPTDGVLKMYLVARRPEDRYWKAWFIREATTFDELRDYAETYSAYRGNPTLAAKAKKWRKEPPTDKQIDFAIKLKIYDAASLSRGQVAQRITHKLARRAVFNNLQPINKKEEVTNG